MYKVTNISKDPRIFRADSKTADILVGPGQFVLTSKPPAASNVWEVKLHEEIKIEQMKEVQPEIVQKKRGKKNN